ncbi:hypothetical protein OCU04_002484 [Sclerotinia nivalis]|uniref:Uncharacterized protein n=1 Tax=Sclerotinia nivalis TaxID=352851 RepID=A0A9X0AX33_9HELO|nr:hypothetical protein OCU04_002484 [Sclerotinia nivalis]
MPLRSLCPSMSYMNTPSNETRSYLCIRPDRLRSAQYGDHTAQLHEGWVLSDTPIIDSGLVLVFWKKASLISDLQIENGENPDLSPTSSGVRVPSLGNEV